MLTNLRLLDLSRLNLVGTIPFELGNLVALEYLYLSYNELSGVIPYSLGKLTKLRELYMHDSGCLSGFLDTMFCTSAFTDRAFGEEFIETISCAPFPDGEPSPIFCSCCDCFSPTWSECRFG